MRSILVVLLLLSCGLASALAGPSRKDALAAIAILERDPLGESALSAARTITQFVEESDEVACTLGEDTIPWISEEEEPDDAHRTVYSMLLAVYFAGNAKAQLAAGKAEDEPYSGWIAAIRAYRKLQAKAPISIPALDALAEMQTKGTLRKHAAEVKAKGQEEAAPEEAPLRSKRQFILAPARLSPVGAARGAAI